MTSLVGRLWDGLRDRLDALVSLDEVDSTHLLALRLIEQLDSEGLAVRSALVLALAQSHGRGRGRNRWASPAGGLYLSWIRSGLSTPETASLPIAAAAAAARAIARLGLADVGVKWPNDLVAGAAKLGGLLIHARHGSPTWATVGLGVNLTVTPCGEELDGRLATSLADRLPPRPWDEWALPLVTTFVNELEAGLASPGRARDEWRRRLVHRVGDRLSVRLGSGEVVSGRLAGLTEEGFLCLADRSEQRVVSTGELVDGGSTGPVD